MDTFSTIRKFLENVTIPEFYRIKYSLKKGPDNFNIVKEVTQSIINCGALDKIKPGDSVALSCSSRDIKDLNKILFAVVALLKQKKANPFIFPAMGSHGGATAEGQMEVLKGYGITEEAMACPIKSSMETVYVGTTNQGIPVHVDKYASEADHIIPIGRIKPHTDFHGKVESGLMKMMTIGFGKQFGASMSHQRGWNKMSETVFEVGSYMITHFSIPFGIGIIEDALHNIALVEAIPGEKIFSREPELLLLAKSFIPKIPFQKVDILLVDEIGKDISGAGMDPNITGRSSILGKSEPFIDIIAVFALSAKTKHNAIGLSNVDIITKKLFEDINFPDTFINVLTAHDPRGGIIPMFMPDDQSVIQYTIESLQAQVHTEDPRIIWIKNTATLDYFYISPALYREAVNNPNLQISKESRFPVFDTNNNFLKWSGEFTF
ncbi:MAG: nickel-dependent lactate racemase [Treponema sp.]|jgi:hypothetical protein|nr:nickel-dependent lactate racemase [Treponema sp.]